LNLIQKLKENKIVQFLVVGGAIYLVWLVVYNVFIKEYTIWDYYLNYNIADLTVMFFSWINVEAAMEIDSDHVIVSFPFSNYRGVWVGDNCNGFKLFSIFSIFLIAYPGNWKSKLWFIPLGILIVHLANITRVMSLVAINDSNPAYLDFNHDYTFTLFVYSIIFGLWYWWLKKYASNGKK
jgi:exosortase/archaeosortase family protein